jgi:histidinol dehydrogenase
VKKLYTKNKNFYEKLNLILNSRSNRNLSGVDSTVKEIISNIINNGDDALFKYAKKFDKSIIDKDNILLSESARMAYKGEVDTSVMDAFRIAIQNIKTFHEKQKPNNYKIENDGVKTSSVWKPIDSVGLYVPGGNAVYPSSVIMNVIPAKIAKVKRIVVATPSKINKINPYILAILDELNITEIYQIGGAHAIAALAYGTESVKPINKIFGPGNAFIASAKKQVFGKVGIDLIAGPSEIVVVADKDNNPEWVASDLIAQAEHDEGSQSILITNDLDFANRVELSIDSLIADLSKKSIIKKSLKNYGVLIISENIQEIIEIIDLIAPEHLHLQNQSKYEILDKVSNAGGIFVGEYSSEAFGDYIVGTNHILPTFGSSKFSSGLGVLDFMKRSSIVEMNHRGYKMNQENVSKMAEVENLDGHKLSVKIRQIEKKLI